MICLVLVTLFENRIERRKGDVDGGFFYFCNYVINYDVRGSLFMFFCCYDVGRCL